MSFEARKRALTGALRREMNGAVVDAMRLCGRPYGLNYGVSIPTIRAIARAEVPDHDFARELYREEVRELRLAALSIARPECLAGDDPDLWAAGIINTEVAAEAALVLFSRMPRPEPLFGRWMAADDPLLVYTALLAAARRSTVEPAWVEAAFGAVKRHPENRPVAEAAVALLAAAALHPELRPAVVAGIGTLPETVSGTFIREELDWRLAE